MLRRRTIISLLNKLNKGWDNDYELFADNGCLILIHDPTGEVVGTFADIYCDGGDPDHKYIDGKEFIVK